MDEIKILTQYNAAWSWHLIAIIFLCTASLLMAIGNYTMAIGFAIVMGISEYIAISRQWRLTHGET